ncbi:flavin reductase family protein [Streptomyces griseorubiginosus]|uniref:flavin reductase family protein n=1 Tax=Streptomyces griseorubiginosus TaxID=67304 RepID=UPI003687F241
MTMNPADFRAAMSHHPTAVCVITTTTSEGKAVGMTVGTFTSVSLDPPLVGFFPDKKSTSWPRIARTGRFCVNLLAENQEEVCRTFARQGPDKFTDVVHRLSEHGLPLVEGAVAHIECSIHSVTEAGDHFLVLGEVDAMTIGRSASPLIFHKGTYAQVAPTARQVA